MAEQPGIVGPDRFPIRDPRSKSMVNGRINNPPRFLEIGGLDRPSKFYGNANTSDQMGGNNEAIAKLESGGPTGVKAAKNTSERKVGD